jgi:hypothetical protein
MGLCADAGNNVYASAMNGGIYMQTKGVGDFEAIDSTSRAWTGLSATDDNEIYAGTYGGDIYKRSAFALPFYNLGDKVIVSNVHKVYESLIDRNWSNYPPDDDQGNPSKWLELGATNKWRAFDSIVGVQAKKPGSLNYVITPGVICDSIALFDIEGTELNITVTGPIDGEVYNETVSLVRTDGIDNWYDYFFSPFGFIADVALTDLPPYPNAAISVTVVNVIGDAKVGELVVGQKFDIGRMQYSPQVGITDYSTVTTDTFGNMKMVQRAYAKKLRCNVNVENTKIDDVQRVIAAYRSTPVPWIGSEDYSCLIVFGFYKTFELVIPRPYDSMMALDIQGLK